MTDAATCFNVRFKNQNNVQTDLPKTGISMKLTATISSVFLSVAWPVSAQDVQWQLVDTGVSTHSSHGKGIEMRTQPSPMPNDLFNNENLDEILLRLCNHYAPYVIPFVQQQRDFDNPDFISVRIVSGGAVGRHILETYAISDGQCGGAL